MACPPLLGWSRYKKVQQQFYCMLDFAGHDFNTRSYTTFLLLCGYFLPVLAITLSYATIFILVRRSDGYSARTGTNEDESLHSANLSRLKVQYHLPTCQI
uniref:Uncharacterized protein n=1 Tax=Plectus sambesii TaxID=2011161 RepID=A0A914UVE6_9BILA